MCHELDLLRLVWGKVLIRRQQLFPSKVTQQETQKMNKVFLIDLLAYGQQLVRRVTDPTLWTC